MMLNINSLGLLVSDKTIFPRFPYISLCKTFYPWSRAISGPRGIILTNFVEDHLVMLHIKYQRSRPCGFRQEDFFTFSLFKPI